MGAPSVSPGAMSTATSVVGSSVPARLAMVDAIQTGDLFDRYAMPLLRLSVYRCLHFATAIFNHNYLVASSFTMTGGDRA